MGFFVFDFVIRNTCIDFNPPEIKQCPQAL